MPAGVIHHVSSWGIPHSRFYLVKLGPLDVISIIRILLVRFQLQVPVLVKNILRGEGGPSDSSQTYSSPSASFTSMAKPSAAELGPSTWAGMLLGKFWAPLGFQRFSPLPPWREAW